jgi:TonB family protein
MAVSMLELAMVLMLAQAPARSEPAEGKPVWAATVSEEEMQGERAATAVVTLHAQVRSLRLVFTAPGQEPVKTEYEDANALASGLKRALAESSPTILVLTFETKIPLLVGEVVLKGISSFNLGVDLRFAGPTHVKGEPMPEILKLIKSVDRLPPLSKEQVRKVFQGASGEVRACYLKQLEANALEGRLEIQMVVGQDGKVQDAFIQKSELSAPEVDQCVLGVVQGLRFPRPRGQRTVSVRWPFIFKKGAEQPPLPPIRK